MYFFRKSVLGNETGTISSWNRHTDILIKSSSTVTENRASLLLCKAAYTTRSAGKLVIHAFFTTGHTGVMGEWSGEGGAGEGGGAGGC